MLALSVILLSPADWKIIENFASVTIANRNSDDGKRVLAVSRNSNFWIAELAALFLFVGFAQENIKRSFPVLGETVSIQAISLPWRFAAAAQRWTMFARDPPLTDLHITVRIELTDGSSVIAWDNHADPSAEGSMAPRDSFLWKLFMLRAAMMLEGNRRSEGEALRSAVCDFFIKDQTAAQLLTQNRPSSIQTLPSVERVELWVTLVPTDRKKSARCETLCVSNHDSKSGQRE